MIIDTAMFWVQAIAAKRAVFAHSFNVAKIVVGFLLDVSAPTPMFTLGVVYKVVQVVDVHIFTVAAVGALLWVGKIPVMVRLVASIALTHIRAGTLVNKACLVHLVLRKRTHFIIFHSWAPRGMFEPRHVIRPTEMGTDTAIITRRHCGGRRNDLTWRTQVASASEHGSKGIKVAAAAKNGKDNLLETPSIPPNRLSHDLGDVHRRVIVRPAAKGRENQRIGSVFQGGAQNSLRLPQHPHCIARIEAPCSAV